MRKFIIKKENTSVSDTNTNTEDYTETYDDETETEYTEYTTEYTNDIKPSTSQGCVSFCKTSYVKPQGGSIQDNLTHEQIIKRLEDFIPLRTLKEKEYLNDLPCHKTWVQYYNTKTKKFRLGGILCKVDYPNYIILINFHTKVYWSVQLKDNIIYVRNKDHTEELTEKQVEKIIKNKLFNLYKRGKLQLIEK